MGRSFSGVDCYGLVILIYREELGIILNDYTYTYTWDKDGCNYIERYAGDVIRDEFEYVDKPYRPFDGVLFKIGKVVNHIGLFVDEDKFIHIDSRENARSRIDRLDRFWESKLYKVVRYKGGI